MAPRSLSIPAAPLLAYIESVGGIHQFIGSSEWAYTEATPLQRKHYEKNVSRIRKAVECGTFDLFVADDLCAGVLGVHPFEVYPTWFEFVPEGRSRTTIKQDADFWAWVSGADDADVAVAA